ncbi:hypothetical protein [Nocardia sp. NBC_01009]|uniref:hypothetical protein n=1 Tax=Nocardia sp. NBC_01009 TaxID=2975996 RepID=UPI00386EA014|nr:hypothetical protein OHA42_23195 [Nocardia sp. NBC_01009]
MKQPPSRSDSSPPDERSRKQFIARNRLVPALTCGPVVTESGVLEGDAPIAGVPAPMFSKRVSTVEQLTPW